MVDASALLWRLHLRGVDVGSRWQVVADNWTPVATAGLYAFNDVHAVMAFVGAGRREAALSVLAAQKRRHGTQRRQRRLHAEVGHAVTQAIIAFGDGDYARTISLLRPVRSIAHRFGGSHAPARRPRPDADRGGDPWPSRSGAQAVPLSGKQALSAAAPRGPLPPRSSERSRAERHRADPRPGEREAVEASPDPDRRHLGTIRLPLAAVARGETSSCRKELL
jgi:hypothetical protein